MSYLPSASYFVWTNEGDKLLEYFKSHGIQYKSANHMIKKNTYNTSTFNIKDENVYELIGSVCLDIHSVVDKSSGNAFNESKLTTNTNITSINKTTIRGCVTCKFNDIMSTMQDNDYFIAVLYCSEYSPMIINNTHHCTNTISAQFIITLLYTNKSVRVFVQHPKNDQFPLK